MLLELQNILWNEPIEFFGSYFTFRKAINKAIEETKLLFNNRISKQVNPLVGDIENIIENACSPKKIKDILLGSEKLISVMEFFSKSKIKIEMSEFKKISSNYLYQDTIIFLKERCIDLASKENISHLLRSENATFTLAIYCILKSCPDYLTQEKFDMIKRDGDFQNSIIAMGDFDIFSVNSYNLKILESKDKTFVKDILSRSYLYKSASAQGSDKKWGIVNTHSSIGQTNTLIKCILKLSRKKDGKNDMVKEVNHYINGEGNYSSRFFQCASGNRKYSRRTLFKGFEDYFSKQAMCQ